MPTQGSRAALPKLRYTLVQFLPSLQSTSFILITDYYFFLKACHFKFCSEKYMSCYCVISVSHFCLAEYNLENKCGKKKEGAGIIEIIFSSTALPRDLTQSPVPLLIINYVYLFNFYASLDFRKSTTSSRDKILYYTMQDHKNP